MLGPAARTYTPGISVHSGSASTFQHADYLGSNTTQTNSGQSGTATQVFDAFGNLRSSTGTLAGPFGFVGAQGYQSDADSGLMLLGHRYYDPSTGRFLTRDPAMNGRNWYGHCGGDPTGRLDPEGTNWVGKAIGAFAGLVVTTAIIAATPVAGPLAIAAVGMVWIGAGTGIGEALSGGTPTSIGDAGKGGMVGGALETFCRSNREGGLRELAEGREMNLNVLEVATAIVLGEILLVGTWRVIRRKLRR